MKMKTQPIHMIIFGLVWPYPKAGIDTVFEAACKGYTAWSKTDAFHRARALEATADLIERHTEELMSLCIREAGKTIPDAHDEIREAVDFCRYYAAQFGPRGCFAVVRASLLLGPTGESVTRS